MIRINLHIHSTSSDGVLTPYELVEALYKAKVSIASLTDHDTIGGVSSFLASCRKRSIRGVEGVELSSRFGSDELHILGYRFDLNNPALIAGLEKQNIARAQRNSEMCELLQKMGLDVTIEDVEASSGIGTAGRPHIAQVLVRKGYVPAERDAFSRYLGRGKSAYVPRFLPSTEECIKMIRAAGGLPVWAHPLASLDEPGKLESILDSLKEMGLWGLECWFLGATPAMTYRCLVEAGRRGLYQTAGTDFHGRPGHTGSIAGCVVEDDLLPWAWFCGSRAF